MKTAIGFVLFAQLITFLIFPCAILDAASRGVAVWLATVLPALLPFFILNRLLVGYGVIALAARLCRRATAAVLRMPGDAAFVLAVGYSSGAPVSSTLVADLYRGGTLSRGAATRLLAASANVSPLFIFSVVASAFLCHPQWGGMIAAVHYGSNLLLTLLLARCAPAADADVHAPVTEQTAAPPSFGLALTDSVTSSLKAVALIGGLLCFFFVLAETLTLWGADRLCVRIATVCGLPADAARALFAGLFEVTMGAKEAGEITSGLRLQLCTISALLAFGGLSVHSQIAAQIRDTDLSMKFFCLYKTAQAALAAVLMYYAPVTLQTSTLPAAESPGRTLIFAALFLLPYGLMAGICLHDRMWHRLSRRRRWRNHRSDCHRRTEPFCRTDGSRHGSS